MKNTFQFKKAIFLALFLGFIEQSWAQISPKILAEKAIQHSYKIKNKQLEIEQIKIEQQGLMDKYLPTLEFDSKIGYAWMGIKTDIPKPSLPADKLALLPPSILTQLKSETALFDKIGGQKEFHFNNWLATGDLTAKSLLFSGLKIPNLNKAVKQKIKANQFLTEVDEQQIIAEVAQLCDQLSMLKQVKVLLNESQQRLNAEQKTAQKAFNEGLITAFELNKVNVAQAQLNSKTADYEAKKELLSQKLAQLSGEDVNTINQLENKLMPKLVIEETLSIQNRAELKALDAAIKANEYKLKAEKYYYLPKAAAFASMQYIGIYDQKGTTNIENSSLIQTLTSKQYVDVHANSLQLIPNTVVGIGLKWEIFDGFHGLHEVKKAKIEIQKNQNAKLEAQELLNLNLIKCKTDLKIANTQIALKSEEKQAAKRALDLSNKAQEYGLIKPSERLAAQSDYEKSELEYLQAIAQQRASHINLLLAQGKLNINSLN